MTNKFCLTKHKTLLQFNDGSSLFIILYSRKKQFLLELSLRSNILWKNNKLNEKKILLSNHLLRKIKEY